VARLVGYVAAFWLVMRAAVERRRAHRFVVAVALVTAAHALYALLAHVTGLNPLVDRVGPTAGPLTGSFLNRNAYATYAVFGLLANLAVWLTRLERRGVAAGGRARLRAVVEALTAGGWLFLVGAGLCAVSIVLAQSRAGAAVAVVGVLVLVAASGRGPRPRPAAHAARLTGAGLVALVAVVGLNPRAALAPGDDVRWPVYAALIEAIGERPWLGQGLGGFTDGFRPHTPFATAALEWGSAHQGYLELAYELGLPAAALFYAALAVVVARIWRGARRRRRDTALPALALAATAAGGLHAGVDFSFAMPAVAGLLATLLGIGYAQSFSSRAARPNAAGADTGGKG
jgi:O-antigen ligase